MNMQLTSDERLTQLERKLESTQYVLGELLDGLYNKQTQKEVLDYHLDTLFQRHEYDVQLRERPLLQLLPSTRQGDVLAYRVSKLEETMIALKDNDRYQNERIWEFEQGNLVIEQQNVEQLHSRVIKLENEKEKDKMENAELRVQVLTLQKEIQKQNDTILRLTKDELEHDERIFDIECHIEEIFTTLHM